MVGTVSISIEDFDNLRKASKASEEEKEYLTKAAKELEVFLSFLVANEILKEPHIDEFNKVSKTCKIRLMENARVKIELLELET